MALLGCTMSTMAANLVTQQTINTVTYDLYDNYTARPWSVNASGPITIQSQITYAGKTYYVTEIDSNAFKNCIHIGSVTISEGITSIGKEAFRGCTGMTSVRIPSTVPIIGMSAFAGCTSLISVTIPEGVTSIAHSAFYACSGLKSITIPEGVTFIGALAFSGCSGLTSLTIPASVTSISSNAFSGCDGLTSVTTNTNANLSYASICFIKDGITYQVLNKNTVSVVANNYNYSGEVVIPEYVSFGNTFITSIDANAFSYCSDLTAVTIPNSITSIGNETFSYCTNLTKVTLNSNAIVSASYAMNINLCTKFGTQVTEYILGENVTAIGRFAFYHCDGLTSVTIPEGVTSIGEYAFLQCSNVQEFIFESETPPTFEPSVFTETSCPIYVPNASAVTAYKEAANMSEYASRIMIMPTYVVVDGIKYQLQEDGTFAVVANNYSGEIVIPSSINYNGVATAVTAINTNAFSNCTGLTAVTIPSSITSIATDVFSGCPNLTKVTLNSNAIASKTYTNDSNLKHIFGDQVTEYVLGEDVTAIGESAFYGCTGLTSVTINTNVDISNAKMYFIKDGFKYQVLNKNSVSVVANSYSGKVVIPETVTAGNIFNVTSIGSSAFYDCRDLLSVIIPESVTSIGSSAFYDCRDLLSVIIPESVTSIGSRAFCYCTGLVSVTIPESVTSMGELALANCSNVQEIVFEGETPPTFGSDVLYNTGSEPIYVPNASAVTAYKSATNMSSYNAGRVQVKPATIIVDGVKYSMLSSGSFAVVANNYSGDVVIRESIDYNGAAIAVTSINSNAFSNCTGLTAVTIPSSITSIATVVFSGCTNLTKVILNSNAIASKYYTSKSNLKHIFGDQVTKYVLGENVTAIGSSAFYGNTGLVSVTIPESVTSIGSYAFTGCDGLTSVTINTDANLSYASMYFIKDGIKYQVLNKNSVSVVANSYSGEVVIPKTVTAGNIFNITSIGTEAFSDCSNVQEFVFEGEMPPAFGLRVFYGTSCPIYVPTASAVTAYKAAENMSNYASRVQVKPIVVDGIKYQLQEDGTFTVVAKSYSGEIVIPSSIDYNGEATAVTSIAANAFKDCTGLTAVTIPSSITSIATNAFSGCTNLTKVTLNSNAVASNTSYYSNLKTIFGAQVTEYVLGEDVTSIGHYAFRSCTRLTSVTIPESVTSIGSSAFEGCTGLTSVTISEGVASIGSSAFSGCTGLTSVTIPEGVTSIGGSAFSGCTGLTSVTIPEGVTSIGSSAFSGCTNLTKVTLNSNTIASETYTNRSNLKTIFGPQVTEYVLGEDVTAIGDYAFYGNTGLVSVTISEGVTSIGGSAFYGCTGLTSVTIPEGVTSIGTEAFYNCSKVKEFIFERETPPAFSSRVFYNTGSGPIYVPTADAVTAYKAAEYMSTYASRVKVRPTYTISVVANNDEYGTVSGGGTYDAFSTHTISATAAEQYGFAYWNEDGNTEATRTITLTGNATYTAVFKRLITVSNIAVADKVYDGNATAQIDYSSEGILDGDDVTVTASFDDKNVGIEKTIILGLDGEDASNYTIDAEITELKASITAKEIAISNIVAENKEYDGTTTATVSYKSEGAVENDYVTIVPTATFADKNVGEDITVTCSFAKSGEDADNYVLSVDNAELKANITAKAIAISEIVAENKEYDGNATATGTFTTAGVLEGEDVTVEYTAAFADKNVGEDKTVTFNFSLNGDDKVNYALASETATAKANITAKSIAVSEIVAENKVYDGNATAQIDYSSEGILDGDDVTVTASFDDKNVGIEKTIILGLDGEDASNYTIDAEITELKATITAKEIAISEIAAENKEYDGATEATVTYTANGVVENDDVTIEPTAEFADENVGEDKAVTYSFAKSGEDADNYELSVETVDLTANITAKAIAISNIAVENKEYDGTTAATVTYTVNGVVENDDVTIELTAEFADENVGEDKAVTYSFAKSGDDADNYTLSVENAELKANITAKSIAVSEIVAENKEYDGSATATGSFTYDDSAVLDGESVTIGYEAAFADKNVGEDKTVTFTFSLSGDDMDNYALASETATATANITTKSITISELAAENKEYDGATEATVTYTVNGVVENDDVTVEPTATFADKNVGDDKVVTYSFAKSGEDADNYTLSVETVDLKANIAAKAITISEIVVEDKEYDGTTAVTATFTTAGAIENEDVAVNYTATFDDKNVGENKIVSLTFELSGEAVANYVLASETATAMADITAKPIAISNIAADNKIFDGETTATLAFELEGILENDEVEVSYTANFADKNVGEDKAVTFNFAKSGADEANYELAVEATEPKAAITAYTSVEVTITENSGTETYDGTEKTVTGYAVEINSELYKESDFAFNGTADVKGTNAGEYEMNIVASDFENTNANFTDVKFTVVDGKLTIEKSSETPNMPELTAETRLLNITDVALPEGWAWADETIVLEEGENSAVANYVGDDAGNYTVESVTITITRLPCLHDGEYTVVDAQEATCLVDGYTGDHKCSICGAIFEQGSVIPATGHIAGEAVIENYVAPTCKEAGSVDTVYYCTIDGDLISRETYVLPIVDHVPGKKVAENIVPATTTTEGSVDSVVYCMVGGEELSREHFVLPILDHDHILGEPVAENYKAPTCTEAGSVDTVVYCLVEGEELSRDSYVLPALGHKPSEKVAKNYVAPTCLVAGSVDSVVTCTVCGEILSEEHFVLPALGHTAGEAVVENYTAPTCTEAGTVDTVYYCTIDNEEISRETYVLPMLEHVAGKKVAENYVAPTKTEEGSVDSVVYCTIGGEELSRESFVLPAIGHDHILGEPIAENYKAPTCTEAGSVDTVVYCLVEGEELSRDSYVLPALGHKPSEKVAKNYVAPTCLVAGSVDSIITCTICGEVLSEEHFVLPATGHIAGEPVIENYVAPTCTTTGTVDTVYYCTVDGDLISRETHVLPMLEHVPGEKVAENYVAPTFTAAGSVDSVVYCTIGGEELSRETFELPMLQKAIEKIEVLSMLKTEYVVGEDIDITGAKISVTFNDGSVEEIDLTNEMLSGFDNTLVAEQDITVTYLTFTTTIHVTVNEKTAVSDIATDATSIYAYGHTIVVETTLTGDIIVNDVNGRIVAKSQSNGDRTEIYVPKVGVYAVRIGTVSQKVVVR